MSFSNTKLNSLTLFSVKQGCKSFVRQRERNWADLQESFAVQQTYIICEYIIFINTKDRGTEKLHQATLISAVALFWSDVFIHKTAFILKYDSY